MMSLAALDLLFRDALFKEYLSSKFRETQWAVPDPAPSDVGDEKPRKASIRPARPRQIAQEGFAKVRSSRRLKTLGEVAKS